MQNFLNETANLGTTGKLVKATKRTYRGQTIADMRHDIVTRAQQTIEALDGYKGGVLRAPMARSIRNGLCVKLGYGKRNVGFFEGEGSDRVAVISDRNFARNEAYAAAVYLEKVVEAVSAGEFDELLGHTLNKLKARFVKEDEKTDDKPDANVHHFAAE
ncbi:hypothetical protein [Thalassobacter stenotrophicus]|uniref:Uncharacterized protein n=2 Tax=Thalassobacter stenotrophicus TaxID=266809 RepID=A0A0P1EXK8_9RHOB|nr:hypothetical protein [Thalassobacter stenotrophicus]CUH59848.1 hypothetical protein THS5294_01136 [Thalassobacter stenotrophicus]SHI87763.1 hypothetical protein SAMN02744035_01861 [Thalassobacter stenotrophicus DSM 16310]